MMRFTRGAGARVAALWAILSGSSPLPLLMDAAHRADARVASGGMALAWSLVTTTTVAMACRTQRGATSATRPVIDRGMTPPASFGTLDELVSVWPVIGDADGLVVFVDESDAVAGEMSAEFWAVQGGHALLVGVGAYTALHEGRPVALAGSPDGASAVDVPLSDDDLQGGEPGMRVAPGGATVAMTIGLLTALDGANAGIMVGIEGVMFRVESADDGWPPAGGTYWGPSPMPGSGHGSGAGSGSTPGPRPMVPLRSMPAPEAVLEAIEQHALDLVAEQQDLQAFCTHPEWLGANGVECCQLHLSPDAAAVHCRMQFLSAVLACATLGGTLGGVAVMRLVKHCWSGPPPLWKACVALAIGATAVLIACYLAARWAMQGCVAQRLHDNKAVLAEHGCLPIPPGVLE